MNIETLPAYAVQCWQCNRKWWGHSSEECDDAYRRHLAETDCPGFVLPFTDGAA